MTPYEQFRRIIRDLNLDAQRDLQAIWRSVGGDPAALAEILAELVQTYGEAAAALSADWYDELRADTGVRAGFTAVVPVPNPNGQGFFNWNPAGESVTLAPQGNGAFDLLDKLIPLANFAPKLRVSGSEWQQLLVAGVKPKRLLPHWRHRLRWTLTGGVVARKLEWTLFVARERTI